jgi:dihydroorotase
MATLCIRNGRVIDPEQGVDIVRDLWLCDGIVVPAGFAAEKADKEIDATGMLVMPGFVDVHVHLREPGNDAAETIATGCASAVAGGYTTIVAMPNTTPCLDTPEVADEVFLKADQAGGPRVLVMPALTKGRAGKELVDFDLFVDAFLGVVGFTDDGAGLESETLARKAFEMCGADGVAVSEHCEYAKLSAGGVMHDGPAAKAAGLPGYADEAEVAMIERDIRLSEETGTHVHFQHLSSARSVELIRKAKAKHVYVTAEVTPHHLTLTDADVVEGGTNFKMNPPLRTEADRQALIAGLADGTIDMIATDHAPHTAEAKAKSFVDAPCGVIGLETAAAVVWTKLVKPGLLTPTQMVAAMSTNPVAQFTHDYSGGLEPHGECDVVIFDPNAKWTADPEGFKSRSANCPFNGWDLEGRVVTTIVAGEVRYSADIC